MSARSSYRLAGLAMLVGGVLSAISSVISGLTPDPASPVNFWSSVIGLAGAVLLLAGFPAFYSTFGRNAGALGVVGYFVLFSAGLLGAVGGNILGLVVFPLLVQVAPNLANSAPPESVMNFFLFAGVLELIGGLAFGAAILVAHAPERIAAIVLMIGALLAFVGNMANNVAHLADIGNALLPLALAWMGVSLMTRHAAETYAVTEREVAPGVHARA